MWNQEAVLSSRTIAAVYPTPTWSTKQKVSLEAANETLFRGGGGVETAAASKLEIIGNTVI